MKKITLFIIAILLAALQNFAQTVTIDTIKPLHDNADHVPFGNHFRFEGGVVDEKNTWQNTSFIADDKAIYQVFNWAKLSDKRVVDSLRKAHPKYRMNFNQTRINKLLLGVKLDPKLEHYASDGFFGSSYTITNNSEAVLVAMGINKNNVNDFRYHVVQNDSLEIVHWSIPKLEQKYGAKAPYAILGRFKAPGKQLYIQVVNIKDYSNKDGVLFNWQTNFKPSISEFDIYNNGEHFNLMDQRANHHMATKFAEWGEPLDLKLRIADVASMALTFKSHDPIPYIFNLVKTISGHKTDTTQIASIKGDDIVYNFHNDNYAEPGKYELIVQPDNQFDKTQVLNIPFEVLPPLPVQHTYNAKQIVPYVIGAVLVIALLFGAYYLYNKRKLRLAEQSRALAAIQLKSVRSQLNPHFMFNALTSIQNLMNQHDTEGANHYLSKFAGLTRQILNNSGQELISLEDELSIVTDYLQMEQLRFGFEYAVDVDPTINKANTEIPAMLLQPFIENAAKHGVSALQSKGKISVLITKQNQNLVLTVADNGSGFKNEDNTVGGFGLKLSEERIALLNNIYKSQPIILKIDSDITGAKIIITLTNWV